MLRIFLRNTTAVFILFFVTISNVFGQDPEFTQFYANPLYLNPAFAGTNLCPRVSLNFRDQWPGISGSFITSSFSYDQHVNPLAGGLGLIVMNDIAGEGTLTTTNVSGMYSYLLPINRKFSMKFGLQGSWFQKNLDWSKLTFGDQIDPRRGFVWQTGETPINDPIHGFDMAAGILGFSEKYFAGFAVHHLLEPNESVIAPPIGDSPLPRKYTLHGGAKLELKGRGESVYVSPNVLFQLQQDFLQLNFGTYVSKGPFTVGLWSRVADDLTEKNFLTFDSFIALVGFQTELMKFGYSYDLTISSLTPKTGGSHEFSLGFNFYCKPPRKRTTGRVNCPKF